MIFESQDKRAELTRDTGGFNAIKISDKDISYANNLTTKRIRVLEEIALNAERYWKGHCYGLLYL